MNLIPIEGGVCAAKGFTAAGVHCGIRKNRTKKDLALIYSETECAVGCTYTQNKVYGAPITVTRENVKNGKAKAVRFSTLEAICRALDCQPGDLLIYEKEDEDGN